MAKDKDKDPQSPATTSFAYDAMAPRWMKVDTLLQGTEAMKAAGQAYLPQHDEEANMTYAERLEANVLLNMTELTLDTWTGKPFAEPIVIQDETPEPLVNLLDDVDLQGNNVDVFARHWFRSGLAKAFSHVLVSFPTVPEKEDGKARTLADDRAENLRPYLVDIQPERVLSASSEVINGKEVLTEVRILDIEVERDGFAETFQEKIRVITVGQIDTYRKVEKKKGRKKEEWVFEGSTTYDLPYIPLVTFYADKEGFMLGKPPLSDLADLNITHWQSSSDQRATLTVARFPLLAVSGGTDEKQKLVVGPKKWLYTPDPQGKFYYVEHKGEALKSGKDDLESLERQMTFYGADYMQKRPSGSTATARVIDNSEATSPLQDAVNRFEDAVNTALGMMADWLKVEQSGGVEINNDFGEAEDNNKALAHLATARKNRDVSRKTYLTELKRREVLPDEFEVDDELELLEKESMDLTGAPDLPGLEDDEAAAKAKADAEEAARKAAAEGGDD